MKLQKYEKEVLKFCKSSSIQTWINFFHNGYLLNIHISLNQLTLNDTFRPKVTSPETVKWSSSKMSGISINLDKNSLTLAKWLSPNLTSGVVGNIRCGDIVSDPFLRLYKLLITKKRSEVFFTGKNRLLGTFIPTPFSNDFMAAPTAVSSWIMLRLFSKVLLLTIISSLSSSLVTTLLIAEIINFISKDYAKKKGNWNVPSNLAHKLFVLNILNVFIDLKSSTCSFGTCAISSSLNFPSNWIRVPPYNRCSNKKMVLELTNM